MEHRTSNKSLRKNRFQSLAVAAVCIGALFCIIALPGVAAAHPPKEVALSYDPPSGNLQVKIVHSSPFPNNHYIERVEIRVNGKVQNVLDYQNQPDKPSFAYTYRIKAAAGDTLEAKVICNIYGSKTGRLTIPK
ncbi:MAG: hypothetical protein JW950_11670 [Deltaproteobacteria bacterium]|nr:hypothetical protein [Deltaproteobacteria bacterium]